VPVPPTDDGHPAPTATYRLQLSSDFGFADVAALADYLAELGVSHAYLSPVLQATPGSTHGYDVVDHTRLSDELGGSSGFATMVSVLRQHGLGVVLDVVPNHMAVPTPEHLNTRLWSVLRDGRESPNARWFDIDWDAQDQRVLLPVLGSSVGEALERGQLHVDGSTLRYHDHDFPLAAQTESLSLPAMLAAQHYRLADWHVGVDELNYRRFFDVTSLIAVRVEEPAVFDATHALLLELVDRGLVDGLRIDHPDGLHDPAAYVETLHERTNGCWIVVEKILEHGEHLPDEWRCAGTTGYDALRLVGGIFVDPAGEVPLTSLYNSLTGETSGFPAVAAQSKRDVVRRVLAAEVSRLVEVLLRIGREDLMLRDVTRKSWRTALEELLVAFPVYRAYVVPGDEPSAQTVAVVESAVDEAAARLRGTALAALPLLRDLALGRRGRSPLRDEFMVRFQQTCGPAMAKGVEDTSFYRWNRLIALNEVGGSPGSFGCSIAEFHDAALHRQQQWPYAMTTLSTHDTKRSEDIRARLFALSELPETWGESIVRWRARTQSYRIRSEWPDPTAEYLFWQTLVGAWPIDAVRMAAYLCKAAREAKLHTSWTDPDHEYEQALQAFAERVLGDDELICDVQEFVALLRPRARANLLGQKLLQLTMPGVPDVYQGTEIVNLFLVDPDNRRPVDYQRLKALLGSPDPSSDDEERLKLLVTSTALRLRRRHQEWFGTGGDYLPLFAYGAARDHLVAFARAGRVVTAVPRFTVSLERAGGWGDTTLPLPDGRFRHCFTNEDFAGETRVAALFDGFPVALLVRE
jgi:(1->4)-alpha-D-glucan 1-alpha-D-glucosylmutase